MVLDQECHLYRGDKLLNDVCLKGEEYLLRSYGFNGAAYNARLYSLKNSTEFQIVLDQGYKIFGKYFILICAKNLDYFHYKYCSDFVCLGTKISKKFSKSAVIRNKLKRRIKFLFRSVLIGNTFDLRGMCFIVIPKICIKNVDYSRIRDSFEKVFYVLANN